MSYHNTDQTKRNMIMRKQGRIIPSVVVKQITFNNDKPFDLRPDDIVLLVGPNNVGKSRAIKDLRDDLNGIGDSPQSRVIIKEIEYTTSGFTAEALMEFFKKNRVILSPFPSFRRKYEARTPFLLSSFRK